MVPHRAALHPPLAGRDAASQRVRRTDLLLGDIFLHKDLWHEAGRVFSSPGQYQNQNYFFVFVNNDKNVSKFSLQFTNIKNRWKVKVLCFFLQGVLVKSNLWWLKVKSEERKKSFFISCFLPLLSVFPSSLPKESLCDLRPIPKINGEPFFCQVGDRMLANTLKVSKQEHINSILLPPQDNRYSYVIKVWSVSVWWSRFRNWS